MRITTLGELAVDGRPVRGERLGSVLRALLDSRGRAVPVTALVDAVWPDGPPADATGAVQALVSRLRRLGLPVLGTPGGYRLPLDAVDLDVLRVRTLVDAARTALRAGRPEEARTAATEARSLLPDVPDLDDPTTARLLSDVARTAAEAALADGRPDGPDASEADLRLLAARTPPDEPAVALLVRVLAAQGRDSEALELVEQVRAALADRYGADPSPVVVDAHLALLRGELPRHGSPGPSLTTPPDRPPTDTSPAAVPATATDAVARDGAVWVHDAGRTTRVVPLSRRDATVRRRPRSADTGSAPALTAPLPGTVVAVHVPDGARVAPGDKLLTIEAMKMEHTLTAPRAGVARVRVLVGASVARDESVAVVEEDPNEN